MHIYVCMFLLNAFSRFMKEVRYGFKGGLNCKIFRMCVQECIFRLK
uniref:Uncharacterized protein n=1 Tax=Rhizophora mucronata TaxID=61149 RepID=A0A2P2NT41_RHIMU